LTSLIYSLCMGSMMKRSILFVLIIAVIAVSCARINPQAEDAKAALNYGKALMNEGKTALAIVEFKKALDFFNEADYAYSAFTVYPYIARGYYLSGNRDEAIGTYFEALAFAAEHIDAIGPIAIADAMRELAGLLVESERIDEARNLLMDAAEFYKKADNYEKFNEVIKQLDGL
jgi:tetratricopeptide (TPR) repeat protein